MMAKRIFNEISILFFVVITYSALNASESMQRELGFFERTSRVGEGMLFIFDGGSGGLVSFDGRCMYCPQDGLELVLEFENGVAPARVDGRWGIIDYRGEVIGEPIYDQIDEPFHEGLTAARLGEKWIVIGTDASQVMEREFDFILPFYNGRAWFLEGAEIIIEGKNVVDIVGGKWGIISREGEILLGPYFDAVYPVDDRKIPYYGLEGVEVDGRWGYVDFSGDFVIEPNYRWSNSLYWRSLTTVETDGQELLIDRFGKEIFRAERIVFHYAVRPKGGLIAVKVNGLYGFIDYSGNVIIEPEYRSAMMFREGLAAVGTQTESSETDGNILWGFIDSSGRFVIEPEFVEVDSYSDGLAVVYGQAGLVSVVDRSGEVLFSKEGAYLMPFREGLAAFRSDDYWGFLDRYGNIVISDEFSVAGNFEGGIAHVQLGYGENARQGFVRRDGSMVNPRCTMARCGWPSHSPEVD
jgi:hypothetical protein